MNVVVLTPSPDYNRNAGARIRYGRIAPGLAAGDITLSLRDVSQFDPSTDECDVLIVSKCHDARALLAAETLSRRGAVVGVDLFDDYFSQHRDSRFVRLRRWLEDLLGICDFAMCSTQAMANVVAGYRAVLPVHVLDDPAPQIDYRQLARTLAQKLSAAQADRRIRLCWFGMGDNPYFSVGLSDLSAFAGSIAQLASAEVAVELSVLTNARALDASRLALMSALPVTPVIEEWSEEREAQILRESFACFLPVSARSFSAAKSLNRAVTAISAGCQVLSAGYPLYASLDPLIYYDADGVLDDLRLGRMRLSPDNVEQIREHLGTLASPERAAGGLAAFLRELKVTEGAVLPAPPLRVVHGFTTSAAVHKMARALDGLSVASPFCTADLDFDVVFDAKPGRRIGMFISDGARSRLLPNVGSLTQRRIGKRKLWEVTESDSIGLGIRSWTGMSLSLQLALYPSVLKAMRTRLDSSFGPGRQILSETSPWPFEAAV